jgi:uncharacterized small protein (DUF1192 family)
MEFGEWLQADMPPEERLTIELDARKHDALTADLYRLCCQLEFKLKAATMEIGRLEAELMKRDAGISPRIEELARTLAQEFGA